MKCPKCNAEYTEDMKFCIKCGAELKKPEAEEPAEEPVEFVKKEEKQDTGHEADKTEFVKETAAAENTPKVDVAPPKPQVDVAPPKPQIDVAPPKPQPDVAPPKPQAEEPKAEAPDIFCIKCGTRLKAGTKFCTKCGQPANGDAQSETKPAGNVLGSEPAGNTLGGSGDFSSTVSPAAPARNNKLLIIVVIIVILALATAILLALKSMGKLPGSKPQEESESIETVEEETPDDEEQEEEENSEPDEATLAEIDNIKAEINDYVEEGDKNEYVTDDYPAALEDYLILANEYGIAKGIAPEASEVFDKYAAQVAYSVSLLEGQKVSNGLYTQTRRYYDEILSFADRLNEAGIVVNDSELRSRSDDLIDYYRGRYIDAINEIATRENWSRDEAWELMQDAALVTDENGNRVLFTDDPDDPMRLRYIFAQSWALRKQLENGLANKEITAEDALDMIDEILKETDYNPQLLFDAIGYCNKAKIDSSPYENAFNAIMEQVHETDHIQLILDPAKADEANVDLNHFWYFNDVSDNANPDYQVSSTNGTSAATRAWIRENIRVNRV